MSDRISASTDVSGISLVGESWKFSKSHLAEVAAIALFPVLLSAIVLGCHFGLESANTGSRIPELVLEIVSVVPWTLFGVSLHRRILLNAPATIASVVSWSRFHTAFAAFLIFWQLPWFFISKIDVDLSYRIPSLIGLGILGAVLQAKLSIFLPAAAISRPLSPIEAWRRSTGYVSAIFWSFFLSGGIALLITFPFIVAAVLLGSGFAPAMFLVAVVGSITFEALAVGALSFAYRRILADMAAA